jgi:nitrogen fixation/metabolism regulation signal transduction histidine kinase
VNETAPTAPSLLRGWSSEARLAALLFLMAAVGALLGALLARRVDTLDWRLAASGAALLLLPLALWIARTSMQPVRRLLRAMTSALASYRDGDFSISIHQQRSDELGELVDAHNALGDVLRAERQHLVQRELLLDTVIQNTPTALVLADGGGRVVYSNLAARQLFNAGRKLEGDSFEEVLADCDAALRAAIVAGQDAIVAVSVDGAEESFHLAQRGFSLRGRPHRLYLLRLLTRELSRQEVQTWKKVIRIISHELNNSLAPISSLAHSGRELAEKGMTDRLGRVFDTIEERVAHLDGFIRGYASFAKLPTPRLETVAWPELIARLAEHQRFRRVGVVPPLRSRIDAAQVEQALINLLKNAHESGGPEGEVTLALRVVGGEIRIEVADRGPGMTETVMAHALVPFYSTKRSGTGLGLALSREIVEAHGGRIALANRDGGGLSVTLILPLDED